MKILKQLFKMYNMFFPSRTIKKNIIQVYNNKRINKWMKHIIHHPHKYGRCITKTKWKNKILKQALSCLESGITNFPLLDSNLVISTSQVQLIKKYFPLQWIQKILYLRKRIAIFDGDFVKWFVVNTYYPSLILIENQNNK